MMYYLLTQRPMQSLASVLTMLAGLVVFAISRGKAPIGNATGSSAERI